LSGNLVAYHRPLLQGEDALLVGWKLPTIGCEFLSFLLYTILNALLDNGYLLFTNVLDDENILLY
jgi:hypothetical protein